MWTKDNPDIKTKGVILDLNMYGIRVRTSVIYEIGQELYVQMMKNEEYTHNLGVPITAVIVRFSSVDNNYIDYGMKRILMEIKKTDRQSQIFVNPSINTSKKQITTNDILKKKNP
ncbi:MAG: hypothetical protein ACP5UA_12905 [Candidatus Hydrogenedens sp.]